MKAGTVVASTDDRSTITRTVNYDFDRNYKKKKCVQLQVSFSEINLIARLLSDILIFIGATIGVIKLG